MVLQSAPSSHICARAAVYEKGTGVGETFTHHIDEARAADVERARRCAIGHNVRAVPRPRCSVFIATSLDGFIARRDGGIDWLSIVETPGEDYGYAKFFDDVGALILGRRTYDTVLGISVVALRRQALRRLHARSAAGGAPSRALPRRRAGAAAGGAARRRASAASTWTAAR